MNDTFKQNVYHLVAQIPSGRVMTYGDIAGLCGHPYAAIQKWQFEQDKALSDLINDIGGEGKYGKLLTKIISAIFNKWRGYGGKK